MSIKVCVIDDQTEFLEGLTMILRSQDFEVFAFQSTDDFLLKMRTLQPDVLIVDVGLAGGESGIQLVHKFRLDFPNMVMIVISGLNNPDHVVGALEAGADDFLAKPFSSREIIARFKRVYSLRRPQLMGSHSISLNPKSRELCTPEARIRLTKTEYMIFETLYGNPKTFVRREALLGSDPMGQNKGRSLDVHILSLRKKIEPYGLRIETLRGVGYRFSSQIA